MDKETKKVIAVFRFGVIADFVGGRKLSRGEKELILREKSSSLSRARAYERERKLESLFFEERKDKEKSRVMSEEAVAALIHLKKERTGVSLPVLLKEARAKGVLPGGYMVTYATKGCEKMSQNNVRGYKNM